MNRVLFVAVSLLALLAVAAPAHAFGGRVVSRQRVVVRQQVVRQNVVVRQQVVAAPVYAAPVVAAPIVSPVYAAPIVQQQVHGCATLFVK